MITGRIYKISSYYDSTFYYGSTIRPLEYRYNQHKYIYSNRSSKLYSHYDNIGWDKTRIQLIEEVNVHDKLELRIIESKYILSHISNPKCLNTNIPIHLDDYNINSHIFIITPTHELHHTITTKIANKDKMYLDFKLHNDVSNLSKSQIWSNIQKERAGRRIADTLKKNIDSLSARRDQFINTINTAVKNDNYSNGFSISF
jgi:hypothetical protein